MATRWGIVGVGKIAADFSACIQSLNPDSHKIVAVASRSLDRAQKFADEYSIPQAYGSYSELSKDSNIMLEAGRHVLCEKPMCTSVKETEELIQLAKANNRFLMEGIWSRLFPTYSHLQKLLSENIAGKPVQVYAHFGLQSFLVDRTLREGKEFSLTLDIGVYVLQICNLVFKNTKPKVLVASGSFNAAGKSELIIIISKSWCKGADDNVVMLLDYGHGRSANVTISWRCFMENSAVICCDKSYIKLLPPFHCPTQMEFNGNVIEFPLPEIDHKFNYENSAGFVYEIEEVRRCLQNGLLESSAVTLQESQDLANLLEDVRKRIGIIRKN
uniref:Trans-1,2-dihydrobenzene-1,2-diol dehydrogenase n=1 Tax=Strigamia maritima TaxID=126957 RepID=T1IZM6_STRMM